MEEQTDGQCGWSEEAGGQGQELASEEQTGHILQDFVSQGKKFGFC